MIGKRTFTLQLTEKEMHDLYLVLAYVGEVSTYRPTGQRLYELQGRASYYWSKVASIMNGEGELK